MAQPVRVRFAPSPTGYLHIGGARTALFNYLFARHNDGTFILRIEDTDRARSTVDSADQILRALRWLGLDWDEGPEARGDCGPYLQSQRLDLYRQHADRLRARGDAYECWCAPAELEAERAAQLARGEPVRYPGRCRTLSAAERAARAARGITPALRFRVPDGEIAFTDLIHGVVRWANRELGDPVIVKADGMPTYNFAVVVDDALMRISHVIRGEDHLANTPRQVLLYRALGYPLPEFAHVSMIHGPDGTRLSKRHGATAVEEYRDLGYPAAALVNFLVLLGWSHPEEKEILTLAELVRSFTLDRVHPSPAALNPPKLDWLAGQYLRAMPVEEYRRRAEPFVSESLRGAVGARLPDYLDLARPYLTRLGQLPAILQPYLTDEVALAPDGADVFADPAAYGVAEAMLIALQSHPGDDLTVEAFGALAKAVGRERGAKGKALYLPLRVALTGTTTGPELHHLVPLLGKDRVIARMQRILRGTR